jgi:signal transduction histidine kinase/DNA-binding response OmpR family regulator
LRLFYSLHGFLLMLLAGWLLGFSTPAAALQAVRLEPVMAMHAPQDAFEFVEDPQQSLTLQQAMALPPERYRPLTAGNANIGFTQSAFWLRATLVNPSAEQLTWVATHRLGFTDSVSFWVVVDGKVASTATGGDRTRLRERQVPFRLPAVSHISRPRETARLYIRLANRNPAYVALWFELGSAGEFIRAAAFDQLRCGALYSMPLVLAIIGLAGWAIARDRRYLLYSLYALAVLGTWMGINGQLGEYVFIDRPDWANDSLHMLMLLAILFSSLFSRDFLRTKDITPWGDRYLIALAAASGTGVLLRCVGVFTPVTALTMALQLAHTATPAIGWLAMRRGIVHARWYLIAQLLYSTTFVLGGLLGHFTTYAHGGLIPAEFAFFAQLLFLAVAQYDRMRFIQQERSQLKREYQQMLERQVAERTAELETARDKADQANRSKRDFLANMSHEIRTPINAIAGFAALLKRTRLDTQQSGYLERIRAATRNLSLIVNDLLDFSKIEAGRLELESIPFDLFQVIDAVAACIGQTAAGKGLALTVDIDENVPRHWMGDPLRLEQVLLNLCGNAVKFTERGEVAMGVVLERRGSAGTARLRFSIRDTGIGMTPEQAGRLFQAFSQADASITRKFGGTGLGLAISKRLIELMDGRIWLESEYGVGTTFTFEIGLAPLARETATVTESIAGSAAGPSLSRLPGVRILLVEDNPVNQQLAQELLEQEGAHVMVAGNGKLALELVEQAGIAAFDAVLLDLQMPELDGYETARRLRALPQGAALPLLAMTAHALQEERQRCLEAGMNDHIAKPVDPDLLAAKLAYWSSRPPLDQAAFSPGQPADDGHPTPARNTASLDELLARFDAALVTVNASLATLVAQIPAAPVAAPVASAELDPALQPLLEELRRCLQHGDTRAEKVIGELLRATGAQAPGWLVEADGAVRALEYDAALAKLPVLTA